MRNTLVVLALVASATSVRAQQTWRHELGIQGGYTRVVLPGSGQGPTDILSLPGLNIGALDPTSPGLFIVFPASHAVAIEADAAASQVTAAATATFLTLGLRANYALSPRFYAAAGGTLGYNHGFGADETHLGLRTAIGYRRPLGGPWQGRVEARATFWAKAENLPPINDYALLLGLSRAAAGRAAGAARGGTRAWTLQLGVGGGYTNVRIVGGVAVTALALPGYGAGLGLLLTPEITLPPTVFAVVPLGAKTAFEPGVDIHRVQDGGQTDFSANLSARINYAVRGGWYGAIGGNLQYLKFTAVDASMRTGLNVAGGYRFGLSGPFGGRVELNYTMFGKNSDLGLAPANVFGVMFGVLAPLE